MEEPNQDSTWDSNFRFETREEFLDKVRKFYSKQGYVLSIKGSQKDKLVRLACDRGGCYRNRSSIPLLEKVRKTSSRLIDCPFEVLGKKVEGFWSLYVKNDIHNHEPSTDVSGHPFSRRLSKENVKCIDEMTNSGVPPRQILSSLRQKDPTLQMVSQTIYNAKTRLNKDKLGGRSPIQALFEELGQGGFEHNMAHDENGHLTHLFFAHPLSIRLSLMYSTVFVMDCTYKTNKYKMPLLDIVGVSSFNTSFYACFAFLKSEGEEDYIWALQNFSRVLGPTCQPVVIVSDRELALMNAIHVVFPTTVNLLCVWHINKNILANCKKHFEMQEAWELFLYAWNAVVYSVDESTFEEAWKLFELSYNGKVEVLDYIKKTWMPLKDRFVGAWTEKYLHLGNRVSSRAESAHAKLKSYLQVSTGDLRIVKEKICLAIKNEFEEIKTQLESERLRVLHSANVSFFKDVNTFVSMFSMKELLKQFEMMQSGEMHPFCTGQFTSTMGLPCSHRMLSYKDATLPLSSIHSHWRIDIKSLSCHEFEVVNEDVELQRMLTELQDKYSELPLVQKENVRQKISQIIGTPSGMLMREPLVQIPKGRPSNKKRASNSTRRDPSQFEVVEASRKCRRCHGIGHNSRTCPRNSMSYTQESECTTNFLDLNATPSEGIFDTF